MKSAEDGFGYNERLFTDPIRSRLHFARFKWFAGKIQDLKCQPESVLELGCFDGKLINYFPSKPIRYVGFDANWEHGLDLAAKKWKSHPNFIFHKACSPDDMHLSQNERFDVAVIMETLEHVPPDLVDGYLKKISEHLDGFLFITVPNEKGPLFLGKWLVQKLLTKNVQPYSFSELVNATLGRMTLVSRREHKGFDYASLVKEIEKYFDVLEISGHPLSMLPHQLCFGIGIVAKSKAPASP